MSIRLDDFIGFEWNGHHSSEFNIKVVSSSDRYDSRFLSDITNNTTDVPGQDGQYFYNSTYGPKKWTINIAFDSVTEENKRDLENWLSSKEISDFIFDEVPYKAYGAKLESRPNITWICFDEPKVTKNCKAPRIYKGEGTLNFIAPFPYGYSSINKTNGKYMKYLQDIEFKKNTFIEPKSKSIEVGIKGSYTNNKKSIIELNLIESKYSINLETPFSELVQLPVINKNTSFIVNAVQENDSQNFQFSSNLDIDLEFINYINFNSNTNYKNYIRYNEIKQNYEFVQNYYKLNIHFDKNEEKQLIKLPVVLITNTIEDFKYNTDTITVNYVEDRGEIVDNTLLVTRKDAIENELSEICYFPIEKNIIPLITKNNNKISLNNYNGIIQFSKEFKEENRTINSNTFFMFDFSEYEPLYYNTSEWAPAARLKTNNYIEFDNTNIYYDYPYFKDNKYIIPIYNPGDLNTPFRIRIPFKNNLTLSDQLLVFTLEELNVNNSINNFINIFNVNELKENFTYYYNNQPYYLYEKRLNSNEEYEFKCYDQKGELHILSEQEALNNLKKQIILNNDVKNKQSFVLKFSDKIESQYRYLLKRLLKKGELVLEIDTYKQSINIIINDNEEEQVIPAYFLLDTGTLFSIPREFDNLGILVYDKDNMIEQSVFETEELKYRILYY